MVNTTCYIVNGSSLIYKVKKIPYEAWDAKNPSLTHLRVFGCDAFVHVPKEKETKLTISLRNTSLPGTKME